MAFRSFLYGSFLVVSSHAIWTTFNPVPRAPVTSSASPVAEIPRSARIVQSKTAQSKTAPTRESTLAIAIPSPEIPAPASACDEQGWNLCESDLRYEDVEPFMTQNPPARIVEFSPSAMLTIFPAPTAKTSTKTLFVASAAAIQEVIEERERGARDSISYSSRRNANGHGGGHTDGGDGTGLKKDVVYQGTTASHVTSFEPGWLWHRRTQIERPGNLTFSIQGPDYSFDWGSFRDRVVSFGDEGQMIFEVDGGKTLIDGAGFDFVVYENVFKNLRNGKYYQEFAKIGVAMENVPEAYVWFPCNPTAGLLSGCAGAVPTSMGGDRFDLTRIGVTQAKFLKISDLGINQSFSEGTEGFDLDAVRWLNKN